MGLDAWIVLIVILFLIISQLATKIPTDVVYLIVLLVLLSTGVLDVSDTFKGIAAPATLFLIFMFVVVESMRRTGALSWMMNSLLGKHRNMSFTLAKIMSLATVVSSFISNPSVAQIMYGSVAEWGRNNKILPSKLLLPVAYAIGIGGTCTIIAYPINLVLFQILENTTGKHYNIFAPFVAGALCSVICIVAVIIFQKLLPSCRDPHASLSNTEEYITEMLVPSDSEHIGKTIEALGLDKIEYGSIVNIVRFDREIVNNISSDDFILGGDRIVFSGNIVKLIKLRDELGFVNSTDFVLNKSEYLKNKRILQKVSITPFNKYIGKTIADTDFEDTNHVSLLALYRQGVRLDVQPRSIELKAGDTLLFEGEKMNISPNDTNFVLHDAPIIGKLNWRGILSILALAAVVILPITGMMGLVEISFLMTMLLCITGCCSRSQAWGSINWTFVVILTGAFAISVAMQQSGLAAVFSDGIAMLCSGSAIQTLIVITLIAILMTQVLFDAVVAPILMPIALSSAAALGIDPFPFVMAVVLGAASNFTTQISTAHMMMVLPIGGYHVKDIFKFGLPICIFMAVAIISVLYLLYL